MSSTLHDFLAISTLKAKEGLIEAFLLLPEDKRNWAPEATSRTAIDQVAECALLNGSTVNLLQTRVWEPNRYPDFLAAKAEACNLPWEELKALLEENTRLFVEAIATVPAEDLEIEVAMPWGAMKISEILAFPYWNMTYHQGQITYIASLIKSLY